MKPGLVRDQSLRRAYWYGYMHACRFYSMGPLIGRMKLNLPSEEHAKEALRGAQHALSDIERVTR